MFTAMQVVQVAALIVILLALLTLFCAIDLIVDVKKKGQDISGRVVVKWLFLSYSRFFYPSGAESSAPKKGKDAGKKEEMEKSGHISAMHGETVPEEKSTDGTKSTKKKKELKIKDLVKIFLDVKKPLLRFINDVMCNLRFRSCRCAVTFGLPDPADTGVLCGFLFGIFGSLRHYRQNFSYFLEPRFDDKMLDIELIADVRVRIYRFIFIFLRFALDRGVLRTGWLLVRTYR